MLIQRLETDLLLGMWGGQ